MRQTYEFSQALPDAVLDTPGKAALSMTANLFITSPAVADIGNYVAETNASSQLYLADPINHLFRDIYLGGLMLALSLIGCVLSIKNAFTKKAMQGQRWILLASAALVQIVALLFTVTLPFQRYVIPLVPFTCLWTAYSLLLLKEKASQISFKSS